MNSLNFNSISSSLWINITKEKMQQKHPIAIFMMGLPASGKSTVIDQFLKQKLKLEYTDFIHIDPDLFMKKHPDYENSHPEEFNKLGVILSSKILNKIYNDTYNFIYYGTGKNYSQYMTMINKSHKLGFHTILLNVLIEKKEAKKRSKKRKRKVPDNVINKINNELKNTHTKSKKYKGKTNFEILSNLDSTDNWFVYNNNPKKAILIDSKK
jgi:predicted kinase